MTRQTGRFRREDRLRRPWEFRRTSRRGRRVASEAFVVLAAPTVLSPKGQERDVQRLGLTVSRRVGNSVVRNRVKRSMREWFRRERSTLPSGVDLMVIARRPAAELTGREIGRSLSDLTSGLGKVR